MFETGISFYLNNWVLILFQILTIMHIVTIIVISPAHTSVASVS